MSKFAPIKDSHNWFIGEDKIIEIEIEGTDDASLWALEWVLRESEFSSSATLTKTKAAGGITVAGKFASVIIARNDTLTLAPGTYHHTLRRTDSLVVTVIAEGPAVLKRTASR